MRGVAVAQMAAGAALLAADRRPQTRPREDATAVDGLALGLAQACALVPGVSRNGAYAHRRAAAAASSAARPRGSRATRRCR